MDKIDFPNGFLPAEFLKTEKKKNARKGAPKTAFSHAVDLALHEDERGGTEETHTVSDVSSNDGLEKLLDDIHSLGEQLKDAPTLDKVVRYKNAVKGFLKHVVQNSLKVEEHESRANIMNRKRYTLIRVIDQKLESLAAGVLMNQKDQIVLLGRVNEIQGLLVDLLH